MKNYIKDYNNVRLHSAIGYVTPMARLWGLDEAIHSDRREKLQVSKMNREKVYRERLAKQSEASTTASFIGAQGNETKEVYKNEFAVAPGWAENEPELAVQ